MKKITLIVTLAFMTLCAGAQDVPAKKVIADYLKAIGGQEELKKIKTIWMTSEQDLMASGKANVTREGKADTSVTMNAKLGKLLLETKEMTLGKLLTITTGVSDSPKTPFNFKIVFDGTGGYVMQNGIQSSIPEVELARLKRTTQPIIQMQYISDPGIRLEKKGIESLNGKDCYKIQVYFPDGGGSRAEYYDINSKLLARRVDSSGNAIEITDYSDYRMEGHVLFSYKQVIIHGEGGTPQERRMTSIQLNKGVSESDFTSGKKK